MKISKDNPMGGRSRPVSSRLLGRVCGDISFSWYKQLVSVIFTLQILWEKKECMCVCVCNWVTMLYSRKKMYWGNN